MTDMNPASRARYVLAIIFIATVAWSTAGAQTIPPADGSKACFTASDTQDDWTDLPDGDKCRVVEFGAVVGVKSPIYYQLQVYLSQDQAPEAEQSNEGLIVGGPLNDGAGVVLLAPVSSTPLGAWSGGGAVITAPRVVQTTQGPILIIAMSADISSNPNHDAVFRYIAGKWTLMTDDWSKQVKVPQGMDQRHGNAMDWKTLRAFGAFWLPNDLEYDPTGGSYIAQLPLDGSHLSLSSIFYSRNNLPFP